MGKKSRRKQTRAPQHQHHKAGQGTHKHHQLYSGSHTGHFAKQNHANNNEEEAMMERDEISFGDSDVATTPTDQSLHSSLNQVERSLDQRLESFRNRTENGGLVEDDGTGMRGSFYGGRRNNSIYASQGIEELQRELAMVEEEVSGQFSEQDKQEQEKEVEASAPAVSKEEEETVFTTNEEEKKEDPFGSSAEASADHAMLIQGFRAEISRINQKIDQLQQSSALMQKSNIVDNATLPKSVAEKQTSPTKEKSAPSSLSFRDLYAERTASLHRINLRIDQLQRDSSALLKENLPSDRSLEVASGVDDDDADDTTQTQATSSATDDGTTQESKTEPHGDQKAQQGTTQYVMRGSWGYKTPTQSPTRSKKSIVLDAVSNAASPRIVSPPRPHRNASVSSLIKEELEHAEQDLDRSLEFLQQRSARNVMYRSFREDNDEEDLDLSGLRRDLDQADITLDMDEVIGHDSNNEVPLMGAGAPPLSLAVNNTADGGGEESPNLVEASTELEGSSEWALCIDSSVELEPLVVLEEETDDPATPSRGDERHSDDKREASESTSPRGVADLDMTQPPSPEAQQNDLASDTGGGQEQNEEDQQFSAGRSTLRKSRSWHYVRPLETIHEGTAAQPKMEVSREAHPEPLPSTAKETRQASALVFLWLILSLSLAASGIYYFRSLHPPPSLSSPGPFAAMNISYGEENGSGFRGGELFVPEVKDRIAVQVEQDAASLASVAGPLDPTFLALMAGENPALEGMTSIESAPPIRRRVRVRRNTRMLVVDRRDRRPRGTTGSIHKPPVSPEPEPKMDETAPQADLSFGKRSVEVKEDESVSQNAEAGPRAWVSSVGECALQTFLPETQQVETTCPRELQQQSRRLGCRIPILKRRKVCVSAAI